MTMQSTLVRVARADDVREGEMHVVNVGGTKVTLTRVDGHLHAFDDKCTHAGCSLAGGLLESAAVTCPCHGSRFDVTSGEVLRGPAQRPVRSRSVATEGDDLLLEI